MSAAVRGDVPMRDPGSLDHYELLDVARDASPEEIERAYRIASATWAEGSLATYSLFGDEEVGALRERIEHAFRVLSDADARAAYDSGLAPAEASEPRDADELPFDLDIDLSPEAPEPRAEALPALAGFEESFEEEGVPYDGQRLRRNRLQRGVELDQIARVTKISPTNLRFIEDENFEMLPAAVYVRGFVTAYARALGLDPARVAPDYMERLEEARVESARQASGRRARR
jgi:flagellar biosynthesis protein FlhG